MPRGLFLRDLNELLGEPSEPVVDGCTPEIAAIVCRILEWQPVTVASLVADGLTEAEARSQLAKATSLVLRNRGGAVAVASRLFALTAESDASAAVAASRAFKEVVPAAQCDAERLETVRAKFQKLARGRS